MLPALNRVATAIVFLLVIGVGTAGLIALPIEMTQETILTMVLPSMVIFGAIMLLIGIAHGKHQT